jgi:hypothetical protein
LPASAYVLDTRYEAPRGTEDPSANTRASPCAVQRMRGIAKGAKQPLLVRHVQRGGHAALDFAQCYADRTIGSAIIAFLNDHYTNKSYLVPQNNNGFVAISNSGAAKFLTAIRQHILANKAPGWNEDIDDKTVCKHLAGR